MLNNNEEVVNSSSDDDRSHVTRRISCKSDVLF